MAQGKQNRTKGHRAERKYVKIFKELGYDKCCTTRVSSKLLDSCKIDLDNIPYNVQIKAGHQKGLSINKARQILSEMKSSLLNVLPKENPVHDRVSFVLHENQGKPGVKRNEFDTMVLMTFEDFIKLTKNTDQND